MEHHPEWAVNAADIPDTACVLRRVPAQGIDADYLPTTGNFRERDDDTGTGLSITYWQSGQDERDVLRFEPTFGLISIVVADIRFYGLVIVRVPLVGNLNHCEIFGNITQAARKGMKRSSRWVRSPPSLDAALFGPLDVHQAEVAPRAHPKS